MLRITCSKCKYKDTIEEGDKHTSVEYSCTDGKNVYFKVEHECNSCGYNTSSEIEFKEFSLKDSGFVYPLSLCGIYIGDKFYRQSEEDM